MPSELCRHELTLLKKWHPTKYPDKTFPSVSKLVAQDEIVRNSFAFQFFDPDRFEDLNEPKTRSYHIQYIWAHRPPKQKRGLIGFRVHCVRTLQISGAGKLSCSKLTNDIEYQANSSLK